MKKRYLLSCLITFILAMTIVGCSSKNEEQVKDIQHTIQETDEEKNLEENKNNDSEEQDMEQIEFAPEAEYVEVKKEDESYEKWLAAAVITAIAMDAPDFTPGDVYIATETVVDAHSDSQGVYVTYNSEGMEKCVFAKPLESARTEAGTIDIYTDYLGYASFEEVSVSEIEKNLYHVAEVENMNTLIEQSVRVTKYAN